MGEGIKLWCTFEEVRKENRNRFTTTSFEKVDRFPSEFQLAGHPLRGLKYGATREERAVVTDNVPVIYIPDLQTLNLIRIVGAQVLPSGEETDRQNYIVTIDIHLMVMPAPGQCTRNPFLMDFDVNNVRLENTKDNAIIALSLDFDILEYQQNSFLSRRREPKILSDYLVKLDHLNQYLVEPFLVVIHACMFSVKSDRGSYYHPAIHSVRHSSIVVPDLLNVGVPESGDLPCSGHGCLVKGQMALLTKEEY
ncbi:hypothetical protein TNCV_120251 [Trichonephila clavipes]|nr:hypothetical protein TNCV_120251 [Trichonephila clavipes]